MKDIIGAVKRHVNSSYKKLNELPKANSSRIGGTYYGSTQLFSSVGNMLGIIKNQSYISYDYGGRTCYNNIYALKVGGAYNSDESRAIEKKLRDYIKAHHQEIFDAGWCIVDDYGTNFSVYGIAKR